MENDEEHTTTSADLIAQVNAIIESMLDMDNERPGSAL